MAPPDDLPMLLPAELWNCVYEDVLLYDHAMQHASYKLRFSPNGHARLDRQYPALLLTSKQIRADALPMFFAMNSFQLVMSMNQLPRARHWISSLEKDQQNRKASQQISPLGRITMDVIACTWSEIRNLLPLAEFAREYAGVFRGLTNSGYHNHIKKALQEIAALGRKARKQNKTPEQLKEMFERWATKTFNQDYVKAVMKKAETASGKKDKGGPSREVLELGGFTVEGKRERPIITYQVDEDEET